MIGFVCRHLLFVFLEFQSRMYNVEILSLYFTKSPWKDIRKLSSTCIYFNMSPICI